MNKKKILKKYEKKTHTYRLERNKQLQLRQKKKKSNAMQSKWIGKPREEARKTVPEWQPHNTARRDAPRNRNFINLEIIFNWLTTPRRVSRAAQKCPSPANTAALTRYYTL